MFLGYKSCLSKPIWVIHFNHYIVFPRLSKLQFTFHFPQGRGLKTDLLLGHLPLCLTVHRGTAALQSHQDTAPWVTGTPPPSLGSPECSPARWCQVTLAPAVCGVLFSHLHQHSPILDSEVLPARRL
uniref:Uncharacterized protein n=1 Tax=Molossus molossus TaxID=27622 RepID=A0A7J8HC52_MOLMO|nr:hypothetical protein HJG59_011206 [Molossus molossus]